MAIAVAVSMARAIVAGRLPRHVELTGPALWFATMLGTLGLIGALGGSSLGAYGFLAVWGLIFAARANSYCMLLMRAPVLWLMPAMALLSTFWSQAPQASLRAAIELALTVAVSSLAAGLVRPRAFVSAISVSLLFGAIASLLFGRYGTDGISQTVVFLGIFASKNTMAMFMSFQLIFGIAVLADRLQPPALRWASVLSVVLSVPLLLKAHSAGALLTTVESCVVMGGILALAHMRHRERQLILTCVIVVAIPVFILILMLTLDGQLGSSAAAFLGMLGKDTTLTGRTVLWGIAENEIPKHPLLGVGYSAFWIQGNLLAEGIWRAFQIDSRMGFTFHDTYFEVTVELGLAGLAAFIFTMLLTVQRIVRLALAHANLPTACLFTVVFCLATRSIGEVDIPYPFSFGTFLFFTIAAYGADHVRQRAPRYHNIFWRNLQIPARSIQNIEA